MTSFMASLFSLFIFASCFLLSPSHALGWQQRIRSPSSSSALMPSVLAHFSDAQSAAVEDKKSHPGIVHAHGGVVHAHGGLLQTHGGHSIQATSAKRAQSGGFLARLKESFVAVLIGCLLLVFSLPVLWFNESRNAKAESVISRGESQARSVPGKTVNAENRGRLIHVQGGHMHGAAPVTDPHFNVCFESKCIRLRRTVEVFQVIQQEHQTEREKAGGGKETVTGYSYTEEWSSVWHDSSGYADESRRVNWRPDDLKLGVYSQNCPRVEFGSGFLLTDGLIAQCTNFSPAVDHLGPVVTFAPSGLKFSRGMDDRFYFRRQGSANMGYPAVGDVRVFFEHVPDGPGTVLALQVDVPGEVRDTFLPYRLIKLGWCGMREEEEREALLRQGEKSSMDLAEEAACSGPLAWMCCPCNILLRCTAGLLTPEIYHLFDGFRDSGECFQIIRGRNKTLSWAGRIGGWLMMFFGLYLIFSPLLTLITALPYVGPTLASFGGGLIWILCGVTTALLTALIVALAYLAYHPAMATLCCCAGLSAVLACLALVPHT